MTMYLKRKYASALTVAVVVAMFLALPVSRAFAAPGNAENGAKLYMKKCWWCHGKEGEADGPGADFMLPPPRDFSEGVYKYKTSGPKAEVVRDEDLFHMISNGMPGTAMPSWKEILNDQERWDLVAHIKALTDMFEDMPNPAEISYAGKVASSPESIEKGKKLFMDTKCFECHGEAGRGNTMKKLKEEASGSRVWPRNLTKPWTFRGGYTQEAIFARITSGIPNTPMPAHAADATGNGKLAVEDRWHVVNYVMSLDDPRRALIDGAIVVKGKKVAALPTDENDPAWSAEGIESTSFFLVPQIIQKDRFFQPANDLVLVTAVYTGEEIAFLMELDDRTKSVVGDAKAKELAWGTLTPDALAIQTPVELKQAEMPYFGHGDSANPVSMLYWSAGSSDKPNVSQMLTTTGPKKHERADGEAAGFTTSSSYKDGTWKVMMKRKMKTGAPDKETQFDVGIFYPIGFANWDGSNGEAGSKHTLTAWRWLLLEPDAGSKVVVYPAAIFFILVIGQFIFASVGRRKES